MLALEIQNLQKTYANGFQALKGVSLGVDAGDFFALLGPNGAGKSTLIGIVCSLVNASGGDVRVFGKTRTEDHYGYKSALGVVPQEMNFNLFEAPIDVVVNQAGYYGIPRDVARARAEQHLRELGLWDKAFGRARDLSGGMKRRLMIARALIHEPKLLILDEPTAGVDIELRRSMWGFLERINGEGTTIILTTHYLEEAENLCRSIAIIDHGLIVEDAKMKDLLNRLHVQTFVLDLATPLVQVPEVVGFTLRQSDSTTLEIDLVNGHKLNDLFTWLSQHGIYVVGLRNKTNRLEELFVNLVGGGDFSHGVNR